MEICNGVLLRPRVGGVFFFSEKRVFLSNNSWQRLIKRKLMTERKSWKLGNSNSRRKWAVKIKFISPHILWTCHDFYIEIVF